MTNLPHRVVASAPPNIAFVKYWGKRDLTLNLPMSDSVSACLDAFHTRVELSRGTASGMTEVLWNGTPLGPPHYARFTRILKILGEATGSLYPVRAEVWPGLPHRVGVAGSAAAMAAFAKAASALYGLDPGTLELSALARLGSGSATRSIPDGFAWWHKGLQSDGSDSFADSIAPAAHWPELRIVIVLLTTQPKQVSSTEGMIRTARTSPWIDGWTRQCSQLSSEAVEAICQRDFEQLARISQTSAMSMHSMNLSASPPILYLIQETVRVLELVHEMRSRMPVFFTIDAGPNPILFTLSPYLEEVVGELSATVRDASLLTCRVGQGAVLESWS